MHLIEDRNVGTGGEIGNVSAQVALAGPAFHCEDRFAATHNDEVDFPSGGVAKYPNQSSGNLPGPACLRNSPGVTPIFFLNKRLMYSG